MAVLEEDTLRALEAIQDCSSQDEAALLLSITGWFMLGPYAYEYPTKSPGGWAVCVERLHVRFYPMGDDQDALKYHEIKPYLQSIARGLVENQDGAP